MNIKNILAYQDEERKLIKIQRELKESVEAKKVMKIRKENSEYIEELTKLDNMASINMKAYERCEENLVVLTKEFEEIKGAIADVDDIKECEFYVKKLNELQGKIEAVSRDLDRYSRDIENGVKTAQNYHAKVISTGSNYVKANNAFKELKNSKAGEVKLIQDNMNSLREKCESKLVEIYDKERKANLFPVFVKFQEPNKCQGCGMDFTNDVVDKLKKDQIVECPNCGRIMYIDEE